MSIEIVQTYGQIHLDWDQLEKFGTLATLTLTAAGIEISPYKIGDDYRIDCHVAKLSGNRLNLPIQYRHQLEIRNTVEVCQLESGVILVRPYAVPPESKA